MFAVAVGAVALYVKRTVANAQRPGDTVGNVKAAVLLVIVVAVPVVSDPRTLDQFNLPKFTAITIAALVLATVLIIDIVNLRSSPVWRNGLHWPVLALLAWTAITTATSIDPRLSVLGAMGTNDGLLTAAALAVIFFALIQTIALDQVKAVLAVIYFGAGGLTVLYGLIQLHDRLLSGSSWDWVRTLRGKEPEAFADGAIFSSLGNPNHLGGFLAVLLPLGLVLLILHKSRRERVLIGLIMASAVVELLQTASRGALLAVLAALGAAALLLWPDIRQYSRISWPMGAALAAVVVMSALALAAQPRFSAKLSSGLTSTSTMSQRLGIWKVGVSMANARPLLGHGPDTWADRGPKFQDAQMAETHPGYYSNGAHNLFIGQMAATGYVGLVLLLAVLALAGMRAVGTWTRLREVESRGSKDDAVRAHQARLCLVAVVAGLTAYLTQASFNIAQLGLSVVFWTLLGLLCVLSLGVGVPTSLRVRALVGRPSEPITLREDAKTPSRPSPRSGPRGRDVDVATLAAATLACAGLLVALSSATRPLRADHNAAASAFDSVVAQRSPPHEAARLSERAAARATKAIELNPWEASYLFERANDLAKVALSVPNHSPTQARALHAARRDYERAAELRPHNAFLLERYADVLLKIQQLDPGNAKARAEAIDALQRAAKANPYSSPMREQLNRLVTS